MHAATLQSTKKNAGKDALGQMTITLAWAGQLRWCRQVACQRLGLDETVGDLGCCNEGLHRGRLGDNKSLSGRWQHDGLHGSDRSTMVRVVAATTLSVGTALLWHGRRSAQQRRCRSAGCEATDCQQRLPRESGKSGR